MSLEIKSLVLDSRNFFLENKVSNGRTLFPETIYFKDFFPAGLFSAKI